MKLIGVMFAAAILCAGVLLPYVGGIGLLAKSESDRFLNTTCDLQEATPPQGTTFYANDGKTVLATIFTQNRKPVPLSDIPKFVQTALIDTEDRRFYSHHGVDVRGLIRSAFSTSGGDTQGGSTLTMQYVKQSRYYRDIDDFAKQQQDISQTIDRKLQDAKCAIDLEKRESKSEILDNYFNIAFFGENAYSIESAAETYFGTPTDGSTAVSHLTLPQAALLVGLLQAPTDYDPFQHPVAAKTRRNEVIENMVTAGDLSAAQAKTYEAEPISLSTPTPPNVTQDCYNTPSTIANVGFFCDYVESWLTNVEGLASTDIKTGGLKVITTLDPTIQNSAQAALTAKFPATSVTTALMPVVDPTTGNVLAMVASKPYGLDPNSPNIADPIFTAYDARSASTYKYFSMVSALEAGVPPSLQISTNTPDNKGYATQHCLAPMTAVNGDQNISYAQTETMATAIAKSSNTYFVGLEDGLFNCDLSPILKTMSDLGMKNMQQKDPDDASGKNTYAQQIVAADQPTLTLGEIPTSPLELTSAYAAADNDGIYCTPAPVTAISDKNGNAIAVKRTPCAAEMTPQVARQALSLLTGDTLAGGTSAKVFAGSNWYSGSNKSLIAGKTGTDVAQVSATNPAEVNTSFWFVGMTSKLVATMALINVASPEKPISGIPGMSDATAQTTADASVAAGYWLAALAPTITPSKWTFASPNAVPGSVPVPSVIGLSPAVAESTLSTAGFKAAAFGNGTGAIDCGATAMGGTVGYYGPTFAAPGTTITYCISNGQKPHIFSPSAIPPKTTPPASGALPATTPPAAH
jgi:membrane peptidoglycan carboxypeptidase